MPRAEFERELDAATPRCSTTPPRSSRRRCAAPSIAWLWPFVRPHRPLLWRALGLAVVVSVLQMVLPVFTQVIVDRVLVEQDVSLLNLLIAGMAVDDRLHGRRRSSAQRYLL